MARMTNEYGSAFKTVYDPEVIEELKGSGWRVVEEAPQSPTPAVAKPAAKEAADPPKIKTEEDNPLMFRGKYLTQWVRIGTKKDLMAIFDYYGIEYNTHTIKNDMVIRLRQHIREVKAAARGRSPR